MKNWTGHSNLRSIANWNLEYANPHQATSEPVAILPPTPRQALFVLVTPPNDTNHLAIPILDLAYASMSGLCFQAFDTTLHPSRQTRPEVFLAVLLVRQLEEVNVYL